MNNNKTSVEWLFQKLWDEPKDKFTWYAILKQVKEMHKEQVLGFKDLVDNHQIDALENNTIYLTAEELYNKIYGGNNEQ
jgi:hypothetical protein